MGSLLDQLRAQTQSVAAEAWQPDRAGDGIEGVVVRIDTRDATASTQEYPVVVIDTDGTVVAWHAAGTIAAEQLELHTPAAGDRIAVMYGGDHRSSTGRRYKRWTIAVEHAAAPAAPRALDPRAEQIVDLLNTIPDAAARSDAKTKFAARYGVPQTVPADRLDAALAWTLTQLENT
jgi:hypothetical protein